MSLLWAERTLFFAGDVAALREPVPPRARVTVVLSNALVRYAIVPFDPAVSGADEELALARFHFTRIHGERAKGWALRLSRGARGAARLASAVDAEVITTIRACFPKERKARLVSIQPWLMAAFNRWRGTLDRENGWLVLLERGRACLALASPHGWRAAQSLPVPEGDDRAWLDHLEREAMRAEASPRIAYVHGQSRTRDLPGWRLAPLSP